MVYISDTVEGEDHPGVQTIASLQRAEGQLAALGELLQFVFGTEPPNLECDRPHVEMVVLPSSEVCAKEGLHADKVASRISFDLFTCAKCLMFFHERCTVDFVGRASVPFRCQLCAD